MSYVSAILNHYYIHNISAVTESPVQAKLSVHWFYVSNLTVCLDREAGKMYLSLIYSSWGEKGGLTNQRVSKKLTQDGRSAGQFPSLHMNKGFHGHNFGMDVMNKPRESISGDTRSTHLKISMKSEVWWQMFCSLLQKEIVCELNDVHGNYVGI